MGFKIKKVERVDSPPVANKYSLFNFKPNWPNPSFEDRALTNDQRVEILTACFPGVPVGRAFIAFCDERSLQDAIEELIRKLSVSDEVLLQFSESGSRPAINHATVAYLKDGKLLYADSYGLAMHPRLQEALTSAGIEVEICSNEQQFGDFECSVWSVINGIALVRGESLPKPESPEDSRRMLEEFLANLESAPNF